MSEQLLEDVKRLTDKWAVVLGLTNTWFSVAYMDEDQERDEEGRSLMVLQHRNQYNRAYIYARRDQSARVNPLSLSVLHEVCHVFLNTIDDFAVETSPALFHRSWEQLMETECDNLAMVIWRLTEGHRD